MWYPDAKKSFTGWKIGKGQFSPKFVFSFILGTWTFSTKKLSRFVQKLKTSFSIERKTYCGFCPIATQRFKCISNKMKTWRNVQVRIRNKTQVIRTLNPDLIAFWGIARKLARVAEANSVPPINRKLTWATLRVAGCGNEFWSTVWTVCAAKLWSGIRAGPGLFHYSPTASGTAGRPGRPLRIPSIN